MLRRFLPILLLVIGFSATTTKAQQIGPDSAYTDKAVTISPMSDLASLYGAPNGTVATFDQADEVYVYFRPGPGIERTYPIKPGAKLVIYGRKDKTINPDSSGVYVKFINETTGITSEIFTAKDSINVITVPDAQFEYVVISTIHNVSSEILAFTRYYVDAVLLIQQFDPLSVRVTNDGKITSAYPNPFTVERGTNVNFKTEKFGELSLVVMDIAGREVNRVFIGTRAPGEQTVNVTVPNEGIFMAQLMLDGVPAGKMIKLTAQY
jgi:hypothetical protein